MMSNKQSDWRRQRRLLSWIALISASVISVFIVYKAIKFVQLEFVNYCPQYHHLTAKVIDFHMKEPGVYVFSYQYLLDKQKHIGGSFTGDHAWFREPVPDFAVGKTIKINVIKDSKGQYISGISDSTNWILLIWFIFALIGCGTGLYLAIRRFSK